MKMVKLLQNRWADLALRLIVGSVFLYAGTVKLTAPQTFADNIATFRLLPTELVGLLALGLPPFEVALGGLLVSGVWRRTAALGALGLSGVFALALISAMLRGLDVDCGCMGGHDTPSSLQGWISLGRDTLLAAAAWVIHLTSVEELG